MTAAVMAADASYDPVLSKLVTSLKEAESLSSEQELGFLQNLLESKEINALVNVHSKVGKVIKDEKCAPLMSSSIQVALEVLEQLSQRCHISPLCKEIFYLLQKPHVQSLLASHDAIAQKDFYPHLPDIPIEVDEDEETVKIVQLVKSNEPLVGAQQSAEPIVGATIKTDEETGKIIIARIMHGGAADRSGLIHVGDEVIEVNGINVEGKTPNDVLTILQNSEGTITFKLVPSDGKSGQRESKVRVRAHFEYNPENDPYIPCKEAGLGFTRGEILHIVGQDDGYWWQARKECERTSRAGLIPSRALQERRIIHERTQKETNGDTKSSCASICSTPPPSPDSNTITCRGPKTKKIMYNLDENDDFDRELIATYEEVSKLYPRPGVYRPIVLIGAPGIGRNELKRRLVARNPDKYRSPVPYTTRAMRPGEVPGREYLFVTRDKMEADVSAGKFIESGEYKGHLYGTSAESVKAIVNSGHVCVLSPHYQAIKSLRTPQLKPFIIHIRTPSFDRLKATREAHRARSTFDELNSRGFTDDEFNEMITSDERINFLYGHFFDEEIVNETLATALEQLLVCVERAETEPLWAPSSWVQ
ncbi:MAGUK p55 subfamily member 7 isoform X1 [Sitodiplosis mosellana]|uniref:MAGUK p55 subfamily member 7 isoform X1 n=2 Tax=Sitodiplosis mosellana TaxID=263140 RepID=UPI0024453602|nr:MAGUK p55 subfamily member 7 isoform X1 [Sitodiplosis mosellana]